MNRCFVCDHQAVNPLLDFGPQPLCNRFLARADEPEQQFGLALGQCGQCGLIQLLAVAPPAELRPRFDWITYNEPEGHLDDTVAKICSLPGVTPASTLGAISFKDDTTVARFQKRGFASAWRLDMAADLGIKDPAAGLESIQEALTPARAEQIAARRGRVDVLIVRHILEHAHQPRLFADALRQLVKPGGYLVFEVPDCLPALERGDYCMPWEEHIVYYTPETYRRSLTELGFSEVHYHCYPYANENSLIAVVAAKSPGASIASPETVAAQKALGESYAKRFAPYRDAVTRALVNARKTRGKIAVFGAGHLSCFWVNALKVAGQIEFMVDDHPKKKGMFMPGSRLPIRGSASLLEEKIALCLLSLSPESEAKVVAKNQEFTARGGAFASIFPGKTNSIGG
jgi:hypothetical protein